MFFSDDGSRSTQLRYLGSWTGGTYLFPGADDWSASNGPTTWCSGP